MIEKKTLFLYKEIAGGSNMKVFSIWDTPHKKIVHKILLCLKNGKIEESEQEQKIRYALSTILGELEKCMILTLCF